MSGASGRAGQELADAVSLAATRGCLAGTRTAVTIDGPPLRQMGDHQGPRIHERKKSKVENGKSMRETNGSCYSCNSCPDIYMSYMSQNLLVFSRIEFSRSKCLNVSADVSGVSEEETGHRAGCRPTGTDRARHVRHTGGDTGNTCSCTTWAALARRGDAYLLQAPRVWNELHVLLPLNCYFQCLVAYI